MPYEKLISPHRRSFLKGLAGGGTALLTGSLWAPLTGRAQTPPNCPTPPANGTPFKAGQDTRPIVERMSASSLSTTQIAEFRKAFAALRALPSTDNRTWAIQGDMHAMYCQACNNNNIHSVHGTWNFFTWHRAFLYYFERILGSLVGDINNFRLPYWDWENHRSIPSIYLSPASSTNSLYDINRYAPLASGGLLPTNDGTAARISVLDGITDFATFGGTATAGGACESNPHDPLHDDIGLHTSPWHDMGHLGFAARDPVFYGHHCNLDKIWANWNALASKSTPPAYQNPTDPAFLSERWNFYDENQKVVSISAADVLNFSTNLRYTYTPPSSPYAAAASPQVAAASAASQRTAPVVNTFAARLAEPRGAFNGTSVRSGPTLDVTYAVKRSVIESAQQQSSVAIVLRGVKIPENATGVFDIMSDHAGRLRYLGTLAVVADAMRMGTLPKTVVLDATEAVEDLFDSATPARLVLVPREGNETFTLKPEDVELRVITRQ